MMNSMTEVTTITTKYEAQLTKTQASTNLHDTTLAKCSKYCNQNFTRA